MQVSEPANPLAGAIAQNRFGDRVIDAYFPSISRASSRRFCGCMNERAIRYSRALRCRRPIPRTQPRAGWRVSTSDLRDGKRNRQPRWIAGSGDILRAFIVANQHGAEIDLSPSIDWLLRGVRPDGHIATADGFVRIMPLISRRDRSSDELGVAGWCDKAFRALAQLALGGQSREATAAVSDVLAVIGELNDDNDASERNNASASDFPSVSVLLPAWNEGTR